MRAKKPIKTLISRFGYDIVRRNPTPARPAKPTPRPPDPRIRELKTRVQVLEQNFANLAAAYEYLLSTSQGHTPIGVNQTRAKLLSNLLGTPPSEAYFIIEALAETKSIPGDVCEFGVAQGETSTLIANEIADTSKQLHLFDSFQGLPEPTDKDQLKDDIFKLGSMEAYTGTMMMPIDMVQSRLQAITFPSSRYTIHSGFVEQVIPTDPNLPQQVSFAYVDFDFYQPIKTALDFLHTVMPRGAKIVIDDYDFFSTGAKTAVQEFLDAHRTENAYAMFTPNTQFGYFTILTKCV